MAETFWAMKSLMSLSCFWASPPEVVVTTSQPLALPALTRPAWICAWRADEARSRIADRHLVGRKRVRQHTGAEQRAKQNPPE